jgi:O-antigen/teichoic acid export membrane protein
MNFSNLKNIFQNQSLAKSSAIVFVGNMTANVVAYCYHLFMGRMLGPVGYGELSSLYSILYIFTVPLIVGQTVLVKFISNIKAHGDVGQSKQLFISMTKLISVISIIGFPIMVLISSSVTSFLHLSNPLLFILIYVTFVFSLFTVSTAGIVQGYQIYEVPISYFGRQFSEGKKLTWVDGIVALWTLIKYRFTD